MAVSVVLSVSSGIIGRSLIASVSSGGLHRSNTYLSMVNIELSRQNGSATQHRAIDQGDRFRQRQGRVFPNRVFRLSNAFSLTLTCSIPRLSHRDMFFDLTLILS
ncbi:hypothetical protein GALMADRAFT_250405 [Galerina marginata CBS 339.88]|uniref:Uncharacterized protein n=1 Tax=Galerina marginata (strain CBS 339.88) TaxID=685588 RepID=A0A067T651_GALM3|nr:hypothetical protein GALMADRAFT_250405 [Galerina marginata CBS 339.88]